MKHVTDTQFNITIHFTNCTNERVTDFLQSVLTIDATLRNKKLKDCALVCHTH